MSASRVARSGTVLIFVGLALGVLLGGFLPEDAHPFAYKLFQFIAKGFVGLIKGLIVPLLFATLVTGIAQTGDLKAVGRMGGKAILYFEIVTTLALVIGLVVANTIKPGAHLPIDLSASPVVSGKAAPTGWDIAYHAIPTNLVRHAAEGDILPFVVFATLFGVALVRVGGEHAAPVLRFFDGVARAMFKYTDMVMKLTPLGVFGAMAYNVSHMAGAHEGTRGWSAVGHLLGEYARVVGSLHLALLLLFAGVMVPILVVLRVPVLGFLRAIRDPLLTAYSTASSEAALPRLIEDVVRFGVPRRVAGFVIPAGYSFNLDGSTLYLVLASLTIAQAAHIDMPIGQQIVMVVSFMLTSKGVAGVPRATLVIIAGTCDGFGLPGEAGTAMLLAVDGIMDMARTVVNVAGNGLASVVIARWEGVFGKENAPES